MDPEDVVRAIDSVQRVAQQVNSASEHLARIARPPLTRVNGYLNGPLTQYLANSERPFHVQERMMGHNWGSLNSLNSLQNFQQTTANLDRHQFTRANRVLEGWAAPDPAVRARPPRSLLERFVAWVNRRRRPSSFELYLRRAHEHPAVARREGGLRLWFDEWRLTVLLALADGYSLNDLRVAARAVSPPRRRRGRLPRPRQTPRRRIADRLRYTIFIHGPTPGPLPSRPVHGDRLLVPTG